MQESLEWGVALPDAVRGQGSVHRGKNRFFLSSGHGDFCGVGGKWAQRWCRALLHLCWMGAGGVSPQILLTMCLPKLAKATEGKINHREGCLELGWKTGRSDSLCWFHWYNVLN